MRLKVNYLLFDRVGERVVPKGHESISIIDVEYNEDETQFYKSVQQELSRTIGRPSTDFKVLGYGEL